MTHSVFDSNPAGSAASRLVIGTAQFGMRYGATNTRGQVPSFAQQFGNYSKLLDDHAIMRLAACLGFIIEQGGADCALVGVTSLSELDQILAALPKGPPLSPMPQLSSDEHALIDPRKWRLTP